MAAAALKDAAGGSKNLARTSFDGRKTRTAARAVRGRPCRQHESQTNSARSARINRRRAVAVSAGALGVGGARRAFPPPRRLSSETLYEGLKKRDKDGRHRKAGLFVHRRDISSPALDGGTFFIELRSIHCAWAGNATSRPKASERCLAGARL
jgi:hypothetical protein